MKLSCYITLFNGIFNSICICIYSFPDLCSSTTIGLFCVENIFVFPMVKDDNFTCIQLIHVYSFMFIPQSNRTEFWGLRASKKVCIYLKYSLGVSIIFVTYLKKEKDLKSILKSISNELNFC